MKVEILFTAWNRLAFTRVAFELLKRNTDWSKVTRLVVYDDGSEDGTREYLAAAGQDIPVGGFEIRDHNWHSLGAIMNDYVGRLDDEVEWFVKVDNDICMPPGWLDRVRFVQRRHPDYELIGMEAGWTGGFQDIRPTKEYTATPARHIGGVGLMRVKAFEWRRPVPLGLGKNGRAGFTIWQHRFHVRASWVTPDLPVVQLDRIPDEPWASYSRLYVERGWARAWEPYTDDMRPWWDWIPKELVTAAKRQLKKAAAHEDLRERHRS